MNRRIEHVVNGLSDRLVAIVVTMRSAGVDRLELLQDNSVWPRRFRPQMQELERIRLEIERANPEAIDHRMIQWDIDGPVTTAAGAVSFDEPEFRAKVQERLRFLVTYDQRHDVHLQLVNLIVREALAFGDVEIHPISNTGDTTENRLKYESSVKSNDPSTIYAYARVPQALGYEAVAERNAIAATERVLRLIRAVGLPSLWRERLKQFGVEGRSPGSVWVIARRGPGLWNSGVNFALMYDFVWLASILANYTSDEVGRLEAIYVNDTRSSIERKVLQAHYWLGDATLPGSNEEKYTRLALAFEAAIGSEAKKVSEIGMTEMLAERTAFLLTNRRSDRLICHDVTRKFYGIRSKLLHGHTTPVDDDTLLRWAYLVWTVVRAMLRRSQEFATVDDLAKWVREQRYS